MGIIEPVELSNQVNPVNSSRQPGSSSRPSSKYTVSYVSSTNMMMLSFDETSETPSVVTECLAATGGRPSGAGAVSRTPRLTDCATTPTKHSVAAAPLNASDFLSDRNTADPMRTIHTAALTTVAVV